MKADALNLSLLLFTLAASVWCATLPGKAPTPRALPHAVADAPPPGVTDVVDARGITVPAATYRRIVSLNTISDHMLLELVEPDRLIAITGYVKDTHPESWRFADRQAVERSDQVESVISLHPDLVIISRFASEAYMERLREAGIEVFDLGDMLGVESTRANIRALGALLQVPERSEKLEKELVRQLWALEVAVPVEHHVPGMYLAVYGDHFSGGSTGTSYADLLHYGGVFDLAAERGYAGWPQYNPEQLMAIDPPLIVTSDGMGKAICEHSLLKDLRACKPEGRILELPGAYLGDPGFGLVEAARRIQEALHPERAPSQLPAPSGADHAATTLNGTARLENPGQLAQ